MNEIPPPPRMPTFPRGRTVRAGVLATITCLVFVGVLADRAPTPPRTSPEHTARAALREARAAGNAAVAACVTYVMVSDPPMRRDLVEECYELLRAGAVPDDQMPVPTFSVDRQGFPL